MADAARRLRKDHLAFEAKFDDLCNRANAGTWHELDEVWSTFVRDMEEHFRFEEEQVFPNFALEGPDNRELAESLTAQHAEMRGMLERLGIEIQLHQIRAATVESLVELMRKHVGVENDRVYPWLELADPRDDTRSRSANRTA